MKQILVAVLFLLMLGCKPAWREFEDPMQGLPKNLPKQYITASGIHVYSEKPPTDEEMRQILAGISNQLIRSHRDNPNWDQPNIWTTWSRYREPRNYSVLLIDPQAYGIYPNTLGCGLINVNGVTAAGTVKGIKLTGGQLISAGDGPWIIVPHLINNEERCITLFRRGVDHESEHVRLMNNTSLFTFYQGAEDSHPIFPVWKGDNY